MNDGIYVGSLISDPHLYHHGILGMRWGVRRFQNKDGSLTSAGKSRYGVKGEKKSKSEPDSKRKGLSKGQKVAIALVAAGLATYGGYKLAQSGKLNNLIDKGRSKLSLALGRRPGDVGSGSYQEIDNVTGFKKIVGNISEEERISRINPSHDQDNCKDCANAYCQSKINNVDVVANKKSFVGNLHDFIGHYYEGDPDVSVKTLSADGANAQIRLTKQLLKRYKEGDVGIVAFDIAEKYRPKGLKESGHAFNWRIENGSVVYSDAQAHKDGSPRDPTAYFHLIDPNKDMEYVNCKGLTPKKEELPKSMRNRN